MHETKIGKFVLPHDFKSIQKRDKVNKLFFEKMIKLTCLEFIHAAVLGVWYIHPCPTIFLLDVLVMRL